ncbi:MAG: endonuclease domain-containing protein [Hymenobacter sp.]|nr:MAG: endonuclease domain-containing protein [Hymenobacter sp.]
MSDTPSLVTPHEHIYTTDVQTWDKAKTYARENCKSPTPAEAHLWQQLRADRLGAKFRRQYAIEFFIVDFVCLSYKLIIEVDGDIHHDSNQAEYDQGRTHVLKELGFHELRFSNEQVLPELPQVLVVIQQHLAHFPSQIAQGPESSGSPLFWRGGWGVRFPRLPCPHSRLPPLSPPPAKHSSATTATIIFAPCRATLSKAS